MMIIQKRTKGLETICVSRPFPVDDKVPCEMPGEPAFRQGLESRLSERLIKRILTNDRTVGTMMTSDYECVLLVEELQWIGAIQETKY